ncbi:nucleoside-diphosphate-sugar epimerase [Streptacidiphilus sp. EB103A]
MADGMTVLVTGASGLVGAEVTARLAKAGHSVLALLHSNADVVRNNGTRLKPKPRTLTHLSGDITRSGLGLSAEDLHRVAAVDRIVHCAAITDFGRPDQEYQRVNVAGTEQVLALARAGRVPLVHVSTAYVCGERDGVAREDELDVGQLPGNDYEKSKLQGEILVRRAAEDGLPVAVVRPSIVVGAERSGCVREFKTIYPILKLVTKGLVRSMPGHYDAALDLVPVDYVADLVTEAATRFAEAEGRTLHAIGRPLTLRDFSDVLAEYPSFQVPRFVPPSAFSADALPPVERAYHQRVISLYETYFSRRIRFDDRVAAAFSSRPAPGGGRPYLRRLLDHCLKSGYLGAAPVPDSVPALAGLDERTRV